MRKDQNISKIDTIPVISDEVIALKILIIRDNRVILANDIAEIFGVTTKRLNEQVKRNIKRFPNHFMFQLTYEEKEKVVANCDHLKNLKFSSQLPFAFTEHGVIMLANILNNDRAIQAGIKIVEIFVKMRELLLANKDLFAEIEKIKNILNENDSKFMLIFEYLKQFEEAKQQQIENTNRRKIGFKS